MVLLFSVEFYLVNPRVVGGKIIVSNTFPAAFPSIRSVPDLQNAQQKTSGALRKSGTPGKRLS